MNKFVYSFNEGSKEMKSLLGYKGANLAEMMKIGLPVPFGFTVTTQCCSMFSKENDTLNDEVIKGIFEKIEELESVTRKGFGSEENPLIVSVRSGSYYAVPGMMATVLNLGLNDVTVEALALHTKNRRFAYDNYCRFIETYSDLVKNINKKHFDDILEKYLFEKGYDNEDQLEVEDLTFLISKYKALYKELTTEEFPQVPEVQLIETVKAVFKLWTSEEFLSERQKRGIPDDAGTAVNIQAMVFGNSGENSGSGVAFSRNPVTGSNELFGEFLINAQGEEVVAGVKKPLPIADLEKKFPRIYKSIKKITKLLEAHYKEMQQIEFTIENGKLYILQTNEGKKTTKAAVNIAVDMVYEKLISKKEALMRVQPQQIEQMLHPVFDEDELEKLTEIAVGLPASPGAASGRIYFTAEDIRGKKGNSILVKNDCSEDDQQAISNAKGIITTRGGKMSYAAVLSRSLGKCCIAGLEDAVIDEENKTLTIGDKVFKHGDFLSLDGNTGKVYSEKIKTRNITLQGKFETFMRWCNEMKVLKVRTNANNINDAKLAVEFGAEGIGLCRTENMFFDGDRIIDVRRMILASDRIERKEALKRLMPYQIEDFKELFKVMGDWPVNIRLIDPPFHEFLPKSMAEIEELAMKLDEPLDEIINKVLNLKENNPMLGHRGCRLAITYPEMAIMQAKAIAIAAIEFEQENQYKPEIEIMIPLVSSVEEFKLVKKTVVDTIEKVEDEKSGVVNYKIGTMIELPRASLTADEIAKEAEFFSFGTNDLTQMVYGFSRDDMADIINEYVDAGIFEADPYQTIDVRGVGRTIEYAMELGKKTRPGMKMGICGEHGGDPKSIEFCHKIGLNYVSCIPYKVPIARLAAAQAAISNKYL